MKKTMKLISLVVAIVLVVALTGACGTLPNTTSTAPSVAPSTQPSAAPSESAPAEKKKLVVFQNVGTAAPYITAMVKAYTELCAQYGWDFVSLDGKLDSVQNAKDMETAISMNPDIIITTSIDVAATSASYKVAAEKGIPVIVDTIAVLPADEKYTLAYTGPNDYIHGVEVAEMMNEALGGQGNVVILTTPPGQSTTDLRMNGFTETLAKLGSKIKVLGFNSNENLKDKAITVMQDFITKYGKDINGVYAMEDYGAMGAQIALKEAGVDLSKITIIGVGGSAEGLKAVKDGLIYATTLQSPKIGCTQACKLIDQIFKGNIKPPAQLDPYLNYIEIPKVTKANVDQYLPGEW